MNLTLSDDNPRETRALARFAAVQAVVQARQNGLSLVQALQASAQQSWDGRFFSAATIEEWFYRYRRGKFAALQNQPRSDKGRNKAMDPAAVEALITLRREHPELTVKALAEELLRKGVLEADAWSASTLQRRLAEAGLDRQSLRAGAGLVGGPTKAFEVPLPNLLWMADACTGPRSRAPRVRRSARSCSRCSTTALAYASTRSFTPRKDWSVFWIRCATRSRPGAYQTNYIRTTDRLSAASTWGSCARTSTSG
jgi:transposase